MGFGDAFIKYTNPNKLEQKYKVMAYFFVHECGWSQQDFEAADLEFMNDVLEQHEIEVKKANRKK